jgi:hypothetical protein
LSGNIYAVDPFIKFDGNSVTVLRDKTCQKEERNTDIISPLFFYLCPECKGHTMKYNENLMFVV